GKKQEQRHRRKTKTLGNTSVPEGGFRKKPVYEALGNVLEMGITRLPRMTMHWGMWGEHNLLHARKTMPRDFFSLTRFFHLAPGGLPQRGDKGYD
ncbi:unnamed protein product, partial [Sphacelaria rigidula]